jgi:hypothetical protein
MRPTFITYQLGQGRGKKNAREKFTPLQDMLDSKTFDPKVTGLPELTYMSVNNPI